MILEMGTKVQLKSCMPIHNMIRNKNEHSGNSWSWNYQNGHLYEGSLLRELNGYSSYDKELLKRTMLQHEETFTKQVSELHRLYRIQRELMNELRNREKLELSSTFQKKLCSSHLSSEASEDSWQMPHLSTTANSMELPLQYSKESVDSSMYGSFSFLRTRNMPRRKFDLHLPAEMYIDIVDDTVTRKPSKPCVRIANSSSITQNADDDNSTSKAYGSNNGSLRMCIYQKNDSSRTVLTDLNEPLKTQSYDEGEALTFSRVISEKIEQEGIMGDQFQSNRSSLFRDFSLGSSQNQAACNAVNMVHMDKVECSKEWPLYTNAEGEIKSTVNGSHGGFIDGELSFISQLTKEKPKICDEFSFLDTSNLHSLNSSESSDPQVNPLSFSKFSLSNNSSNQSLSISSWRNENSANGVSIESKFQIPSNPYDNVQYVDVDLKKRIEVDSSFQNDLHRAVFEDKKQYDSQLTSLMSDLNAVVSSVNEMKNDREDSVSIFTHMDSSSSMQVMERDEAYCSPSSEMILRSSIFESTEQRAECDPNSVDTRNQCNMISSSSCMNISNSPVIIPKDEATTNIAFMGDLEEENRVLDCNLAANIEEDDGLESLIREAADNLVAMSMPTNDRSCQSIPSSYETLNWLADFATSTEISRVKSPHSNDTFEHMTLALKEIKEDEFYHKLKEHRNHDGTDAATPSPERSRRGLATRRQQRRDFQKEILPGLASLSRHEISEDLHSFGSIMRASGMSLKTSKRKPRGRKRPKSLSNSVAGEARIANCKEKISPCILGWGRTTRRRRRQRVLPGHKFESS